MCGFRVYPLAPVLRVIDATQVGRRMDFDIAILVRLHWLGVPMAWRAGRTHRNTAPPATPPAPPRAGRRGARPRRSAAAAGGCRARAGRPNGNRSRS
ncbi:hypothetical protein CNMCM8686_000695 [Aspergillus fumigatus]|nr:hypothetical protein CNMCM8686_000695 [Aspergillus fumigatus]